MGRGLGAGTAELDGCGDTTTEPDGTAEADGSAGAGEFVGASGTDEAAELPQPAMTMPSVRVTTGQIGQHTLPTAVISPGNR